MDAEGTPALRPQTGGHCPPSSVSACNLRLPGQRDSAERLTKSRVAVVGSRERRQQGRLRGLNTVAACGGGGGGAGAGSDAAPRGPAALDPVAEQGCERRAGCHGALARQDDGEARGLPRRLRTGTNPTPWGRIAPLDSPATDLAPCSLVWQTMNTIFGVVVFLRWGWAVGQAGLLQVMVMLLIGHVIALLTCASVSAICTNGEVGPGGAYYIISRALGPEFGGSIGALFYIAQATGVAFYMLGLAETVLDTLPKEYRSPLKMIPFVPDDWGGLDPSQHAKYGDTVLVSSLALLVVFIISMVGASFFAKASLGIFTVIVSALFGAVISFVVYGPDSAHIVDQHLSQNFTGLSMHTLHDNLHSSFTCPAPCGRDSVDDGLEEGSFAGTLAVFGVVMPSSELHNAVHGILAHGCLL